MGYLEVIRFGKDRIVLHDGKHLGEMKISTINEKEYKKYEKSQKSKQDDKVTRKAKCLAVSYKKAKGFHYNSKSLKLITEGTIDFNNLKKAAKICIQHKVKTKKFIKAQIAGLKFLKHGQGIFPSPNQLCTEKAETRLLDYLEDEKLSNSDIPITDYEKETSLKYNQTYQNLLKKLKNAEATIFEANYVASCQMVRRKEVSIEVKAYLVVLKEEMND